MQDALHPVLQAIYSGHPVSSVMIPDPILPNNNPQHWECFQFPHVVTKDKIGWVLSDMSHIMLRERCTVQHAPLSFAYSIGCERLFASHMLDIGSASGEVTFMLRDRYKSFEWIIGEQMDIIWDSREPCADHLLEAVQAGRSLVMDLVDEDGFLNRHPIDIPLIPTAAPCEAILRTQLMYYPDFLRSQSDVAADVAQSMRSHHPHGIGTSSQRFIAAHYCAYLDGTYYTFDDRDSKRNRRWHRLTIYSPQRHGIYARIADEDIS